MTDPDALNTTEDLLHLTLSDLNALVEGRQTPLEPRPVLADNREYRALRATLLEMRNFVLAIANGNLDFKAVKRGYLIGALKTLQAHLRHLSWQTQQVAAGDYTQRVDFMGEFSEAFNNMVDQLRETVEALRQSEERYKEMARTDALTGLYNRRYFLELTTREMNRAVRYGRETTIILLDLDHFKQVNDRYGHQAGDQVLVNTAELLKRTLRKVDVAARYGGEEFIILLPENNRTGALSAAERIRAALAAEAIQCKDQRISVTASLGVSHRHHRFEPDQDIEEHLFELIRQADEALYRAKDTGRNRVACAWDRAG